ncbi:unnamed protein product [Candida verbasci]|uniref:DNA damage-inducible protein 1 n=1 Tax=Candida verbasci TaxID=1227364 RepID=A0A9W4XG68_9ASCO|nr:unnamed protein product [Candida verbasci]
MQLTISLFNGEIISIDVPGSLTLDDFKAYLQAETNIEPKLQILKLNNQEISLNKSLEELGIKDHDLLTLNKKQSIQPVQQDPVSERVEMLRFQILSDPEMQQQIRLQQPELHSALNNPARFKELMINQVRQDQNLNVRNQEELRRLQEDPDNPENQAKILDMIKQEAIEENMKLAWDLTPEAFTSVNMLFLKLKINGVEQIAMVDSGAAMTTISPDIAEKCGLTRLIDKRFQGQAVGVGTQEIGGKIHSAPIEIQQYELPCSFFVVDTSVGILIGLDMLKRHRCIIDLETDTLIIGKHIHAKFLSESEIPRKDLGGNIFQREG